MNVLPCPGWLSRWTSPPSSLVSSRTIERPRPGPLVLAGQHAVPLARGAGLAELLEDLLAVLLGDPDPGVLDLDDDEPALGPRAGASRVPPRA